MLKISSLTAGIALTLLTLITGCSEEAKTPPSPSASPTKTAPATPASPKAKTPSPATSPTKDAYNDALDLETSAKTISQSAESKDDWSLVASKWEQAIKLIKTVPKNNKNYPAAQKKLAEYQSSLAEAEKKAGPKPKPSASTKDKPVPKK